MTYCSMEEINEKHGNRSRIIRRCCRKVSAWDTSISRMSWTGSFSSLSVSSLRSVDTS